MKLFKILFVTIFISTTALSQVDQIDWVSVDTLDNVLKDSANNNKHIFIDVYTDWCGWCKRMDATTFSDPEVAKLMNKYFIPVKFDAEQKETIKLGSNEYKFVDNGKRGYNELAAALMQNKMSYPTIVLLNEKVQMIQPVPGYRSAKDIKPILTFIGKGIYKEMSYEDFLESYKSD